MEHNEEKIGNDHPIQGETENADIHPMEALLEGEDYGIETPRRGEIRKGTIARIAGDDVLVDIGAKSEGVIPAREIEQLPEDLQSSLQVGEEVNVYIVRARGREGDILLSLLRAEEERDWQEAEKLEESQDIYEGVISGYNKGGLIVKFGHVRGFIPASQVSLSRRRRAEGRTPDQRWSRMVGEPIMTKVIEVDRRRNRLILSERTAAREARKALKERLISELKPGEIRTGHVISLADFGAFVDIGGADGLVHVSEISWKRVGDPREVLKVGQEIQVKVLGVDPDRKRISLSVRELTENPWDTLVSQLREGQLVEGTITKLTKFGAFASLDKLEEFEIEGLIHISELSDRRIEHPREIVQEGQKITLRIIRINKERRRIGLSLRQVDSPEYAELDWQTAMQEIEGLEDEEVRVLSPHITSTEEESAVDLDEETPQAERLVDNREGEPASEDLEASAEHVQTEEGAPQPEASVEIGAGGPPEIEDETIADASETESETITEDVEEEPALEEPAEEVQKAAVEEGVAEIKDTGGGLEDVRD